MFLVSLATAAIISTSTISNNLDSDLDGIFDYIETNIFHTDPFNSDTDGDGYDDKIEIDNGYSPLYGDKKYLSDVDSDNDGLNDSIEIALNLNLKNQDSDNDGYADGLEVKNGYNPLGLAGNRDVERIVEIDRSKQQMHFLLNNVRIGSYYISTGKLSTQTPLGTFSIIRKLPSHYYPGLYQDFPNTKWNLEFKRSYYIHSAYWHDDFGMKAKSGGCINMTIPDAKQIYSFLDVGDKVKVYGKTIASPLPKPENVEISHVKSALVLK